MASLSVGQRRIGARGRKGVLCALTCGFMALVSPHGARAAGREVPLRSFLEEHCARCHGEIVQKAGLRLDTLKFDPGDIKTERRWEEVYERVSAGEMPPKGQAVPAREERDRFIESLKRGLLAAEEERRASDGRVVLRRLNRDEYQNTIHDLFGIDVDLKRLLPEDGNAQGFDTSAVGLRMSSVLLERYLEAADAALDAVLVKGPAPAVKKWHVTMMPQKIKQGRDARLRTGIRLLPDETVVFFNSFNRLNTLELFRAPAAGRYRFRISEYAYQSGGKSLTVAWYGGSFTASSLESNLIGHFDVLADKPTVHEFIAKMPVRGSIKPLPYGLGRRAPSNSKNYKGPGIAVAWVDVEGPLIESWPPLGYKRMLGDLDLAKGAIGDAEKALRNLAPRAFRRPVTDLDIAPYLALVRAGLDDKKPFADALRDGIKGMLCAPDFLFRREQAGALDDYSLASRLSYFLWSSLPDDELFALARDNKLHEPGVLKAQVERMLNDAKAERFIESFTGQWLGLRNIDFTTPDKKIYPEFDDALQDAMPKETRLFFSELLKHDLSVRNFVDSGFAMLNSRLAAHYEIEGVTGQEFRKVTLPDGAHRGGVLCQAAILKITANGTTTSPVIRGNWVLTNILGKPVKPPPPNVPAIEPDIRGATTIREQVAKHRTVKTCASCHDKMDPLGLALENYDVIGRWRSNYRVARVAKNNYGEPRIQGFKKGPAVNAGSTLADGRQFANIDGLKALLLADKNQIARCVAEKLLVYATGAAMTFADKMLVERIACETAATNHGLRTLIHAIVQSDSFLNK